MRRPYRLPCWVSLIHITALLFLSVCASIVLRPPTTVYACTPPNPPWPPELTPRDYVQQANYIVVGQVISTSAPPQQFSPYYSATIAVSMTMKGVISGTQVIISDFGTSAICKTDISPGPANLIFFAQGPSETQLNIVYLLSGPIDRAGVFPATESNLEEVRQPFRVWLPYTLRD